MEVQPFEPRVRLPEPLARLRELALNLRWTWDREARGLFQQIYPDLWDKIVYNPWLLLRATGGSRLEELSRDDDFRERLDEEYASPERRVPTT